MKKIFLFYFLIFSSTLLTGMEVAPLSITHKDFPRDIFKIVLCQLSSKSKNALQGSCKEFKKCFSPQNLELYIYSNLTMLSQNQKDYALLLASRHGRTEIIKNLIYNGANPCAENPLSVTAADLFFFHHNYAVFHGTNNLTINDTPLGLVAAYLGDFNYVNEHLNSFDWTTTISKTSCTNNSNSNTYDALLLAALNGHTEIVKVLLPFATALPSCKTLHRISQKNLDIVELLLKNLPIPESYLMEVLQNYNKHNQHIAHIILQQNPQCALTKDEDNDTPLHLAALEGDAIIVQELLKHTIDRHSTNDFLETPLHSAIKVGHAPIVSILLKEGFDVNAINQQGRTPLYVATSKNRLKIMEILLADPNINPHRKSSQLWTPLHVAAYKGHVKATKILLQHNFDVNATTKIGNTPLHLAAENKHPKTMKILIASPDIDINHKNNYLNTPLHKAVNAGDIPTTKILLELPSINLNPLNKNGQTPLNIAYDKNDMAMIKLLESYGATKSSRCYKAYVWFKNDLLEQMHTIFH